MTKMQGRWSMIARGLVLLIVIASMAFGLIQAKQRARARMPDLTQMDLLVTMVGWCPSGPYLKVAYNTPGTATDEAEVIVFYRNPEDAKQLRPIAAVVFEVDSQTLLRIMIDRDLDGIAEIVATEPNAETGDSVCDVLSRTPTPRVTL